MSLTLFGLIAACQPDPGRSQHRRPGAQKAALGFGDGGLQGGELIFEDDFSGKLLGPRWKPHPRAKVTDGELRLAKNKNVPPVWLDVKLPEKVRVEFDAKALGPDGDIKFEIFGDGNAHQTGYILVFGAHKNTEDWFARLDEHGADRIARQTTGVEKDRVYHMAIVRTDHTVRWFMDGLPFLMFEDPEPLHGDDHAYFAVNTWDAPLAFDNVKVFDLK